MSSPLTAAARGATVPSTSAPAAAAAPNKQSRRRLLGSSDRRRRRSSNFVAASASSNAAKSVTLLDYGAGNVRSVRNAIKALGYELKEVILSALF